MQGKGKKIITLLLIMCLGVSVGLYGCSKKDKPDGKENTKVEATNAPTPTGTPEPTQVVIERPVIPEEKSKLTVAISKESGVYDSEFEIELTCDGEAEIYYTTDGSNPIISETRIAYTAPIKVADRSKDANNISAVDPFLFDSANVNVNTTQDGFVYKRNSEVPSDAVDKCTVIRAAALDKEGLYSNVATNTYFIGSMADHIAGLQESTEAAGTSLAVISLSMDPEDLFNPQYGIYVKGNVFDQALKDYLASGEKFNAETARQIAANYNQKGREWERNVHIDFFESDATNTTLALQQDGGIRIQGNYSRSDLQKGFRLYARADYGKKNFEYPFFGENLKNDAGETMTKFKTLTLRNGGNTAFTTKFSDTYWQSLIKDLDCDTQTSRPCVVYLNGEYWGLYVLQEDYTEDYFEHKHGVDEKEVVLYKGDAEDLELGYKLDVGDLPEGETNESYYFEELLNFFDTHKDLTNEADYEEFAKLVDVESARDYFAVQIWINNKWDWPGKNWSLWKTASVDESVPYADGKWRFVFYDVEFGGVMGQGDIRTNTIKENNYKPNGMLDRDTENPAVLIFVYLMSNENFRKDFESSILALSDNQFNKTTAIPALDVFKDVYGPLYDQFFARYPGTGDANNSLYGGYASYQCIKDFLEQRADYIQPMLDYVDNYYATK